MCSHHLLHEGRITYHLHCLKSCNNRLVNYGNWTDWSTIHNQASNFKLAEHVAQGRFEIMTTNCTPELYDTKSSYQFIVSITKCEIRKSLCPLRIYF